MRIGIAADHAGFELKALLVARLREAGSDVTDFGATSISPEDDYPDVVVPLARAVADGLVDRGIAVCGSGVGASIVANKIAPEVRAAVIGDVLSARLGVEQYDLNVMCLGARHVGHAAAWEITQEFLQARFGGSPHSEGGRPRAKLTAPTRSV